MNKSDVLMLLDQIEAASDHKAFISGVRAELLAKKLGRQPKVPYAIWQETINKIAPQMNPRHWTAFAFAKKSYSILYKEYGDDLQDKNQIGNLLRQGEKLKLPPAPPVEEKKEAAEVA